MRLNTNKLYKNFVFIYIILGLMLAFDIAIVSTAGGGTFGDLPVRL